MATAKEYAQWIIENKDKAGTPEFETVSAAYNKAKLGMSETSVDRQTGAPFGDRLGMSLKFTDEGKAGYLADKYGQENVTMANGQLAYRPKGGNWTQVDEQGFGIGDLADLAPAAGLTAAAIATGGVPAAMGVTGGMPAYLASAGGAGGANMLMQMGGEMLPGEDNLSMGQRAGMVGLDAALGGGSRAAADLFQNPAKRGTALLMDTLEGGNSQVAQRGREIANQTGVDLTPAQISGSKPAVMMENAQRSSVLSSGPMHSLDVKQAKQFDTYISTLAGRLRRGDTSVEGIGNGIRHAYKKQVANVEKMRKTTAAKDYGQVRELSGSAPIIKYDNALNELKKMRAEYSGVIGDETSKKAVRRLDAMIAEFSSNPPPNAKALPNASGYGARSSSIDKAMLTRSAWGAKAGDYSSESMAGLPPAVSKRISSRIFGAINRDFDASAEAIDAPEIANTLRMANKNYRNFMREEETLKKSVIGKLFGAELEHAATDGTTINTIAPEVVAARFLKMQPSQMRDAVSVIKKVDPDLIENVKAHILENALENGRLVNFSAGIDPIPLSAGKTYNSIAKVGDDRLKIIFNESEMKDISGIMEGLRRMGDRSGFNFSGTATVAEVNSLLSKLVSGSIGVAASTGTAIAGRISIAKAMASREGRQTLLELTKQKPGTRRFKEAAAGLASFGLVSPEMQDEITQQQ